MITGREGKTNTPYLLLLPHSSYTLEKQIILILKLLLTAFALSIEVYLQVTIALKFTLET